MTEVERPLDDGAEDVGGRLSSRRNMLLMSLAAMGGAAAATAGSELLSSDPAGADFEAILIDSVNVGAPNEVTVLQPNASGNTFGSLFRAAIQDWGGQVYNVRAYGATGNGSTDDTAAIQAAQAAAGPGCVYFPPGTYLVGSPGDGSLTIGTPGQTFKLEAGAVIMAASGMTAPVITVNVAGVSLLGPGTIDGNASGQTGTPGTQFDCVLFITSGSTLGDDGLVQGLVVQNSAWIGIETINVNRTRIVLNQILSCAQGAISSKSTSASPVVEGPSVIGNRVSLAATNVNAGINVQATNSTNPVLYAQISDNQVDIPNDTDALGYQVENCAYSRVVGNRGRSQGQVFSVVGGTDNVVMGNTALAIGNGTGIELGSNYSTCIGNTVAAQSSGSGIHADNVAGTHVVISNNKVTGAHNAGISVGSYDHVVVTGNIVHQSSAAAAGFGVIEVSPTNAGLIVIADNVLDAQSATQYAVLVDNLTSTSLQTVIHDNTILGIPSGASNAAFRFSGAGVVTDLLVHDNTIGSGIVVYTLLPGLSFGANVRFVHNIVVGGAPGFGVSPVTLPASGSAYTNPGPYTEILYLQGGRLGPHSGVVKDGRDIVPSGVVLKTPAAIWLDPGESVTTTYTVAPTAWKDIKV